MIKDMIIFLLIFFLTVMAFGDSFLRLSKGNEEEEDQFIEHFFFAIMYGYRMALGDFDTEAFGTVGVPLAWVLFVFCTIFNMIVMLNLLIAIISTSYEKVRDNEDKAAYQEMVMLIDENLFLIPSYFLNHFAVPD